MQSQFITENGIDYQGEYDFKTDNYVNRWLMTDHCNTPRKVISDETVNGIRVINLREFCNIKREGE